VTERVTGIGGVFFRAADPGALARWYREVLGIETNSQDHDGVWWQAAGPTVVAPFAADTGYFGRMDQGSMLNFRVRDLDAMLDQLRAAGAEVLPDLHAMDGVGRFGWAVDPEGNRFELWEPAPEALRQPEDAAPSDR
jgi:predicted enzyme related to lactoylglutathione lyase